MQKALFTLTLVIFSFIASAQKTGTIRGTVIDKNTQELIVGATVKVENTEFGAVTDIDGNYTIKNVPVGSYNITAAYLGYAALTKFNINLTSGNDQIITFDLETATNTTGTVEVRFDKNKSAKASDIVTPLSVQTLTTEEIKSNPGGNFDISRVVQALPGVAGTAGLGGFRNDIIIRGGAPNENVYYLDGIEIPVLNHFQTQGSSGGPAGILNVSFIEDVKLSSSAFDARYDNALASVFQFKQREGNPDRFSGNVRLSSTELATTLEGPLGKKANFIVSARRSYLQLLFTLIDLPIRPNFWDFQYKVTYRLNAKTTLTAIGIGAIDEFSLAVPRESTPENEYTIRSVPSIEQWTYTTGFSLKRLVKNGFVNVALSRNMFNNANDRFEDAQVGNEALRNLKVRSQEIENKLRVDVNKFIDGWKFSYGGVVQFVRFNNNVFNRVRKEITDSAGNVIVPELAINYSSAFDMFRYGAFGQVSKRFFNNRLGASFGLRTDMNNFTTDGNNPLQSLSPRLSLSYALTEKLSVSASVGQYFKIPPYTILGFADGNNNLVNRDVKYIRSTHYVTGFEFAPREDTRFTLEGFYKDYGNYPVSLLSGISLANQGGDFSVLGNEPVTSTGKGNAYGFEFFFQQKLVKNLFAVFSYTFVRSRFSGFNEVLVPSAWDNRHLISAIAGYKLKRGWEFGAKFRFAGGAPFTPLDLVASQQQYATLGTGVLDFNLLNTLRLRSFNQVDIRIDKKWNFKRTTFDLFLDIQNVTGQANPGVPQYTFKRNDTNTGFATTDGQPLATDGSNAIPVILPNESATVIPSIGFIVEF